ncbi:hypothetical protein M9Y10_045507 [Tritrichomonas musculus]|uniref:C2 NT-type domain-containing protein n=1 Tax=Tritrichomonas musculus TaxID=1915356 RepID=A0ABR2JVR8_9EUKA
MSILHFVVNYIHFDQPVVKPKDDLRISFTSLSSHQKGNFTTQSSKMNFINQEFTINIDQFVKELLIIIRRKSYLNGDPILGKVLFLTDTIPQGQVLEKEIDILEIIQGSNQVVKIGAMGIRAFIDNYVNPKAKINSSYSMPALSDIPAFDTIPPDENSPSSFFQNLASKFKKNKNFVEIDGDQKSQISGSKSSFTFLDPGLY